MDIRALIEFHVLLGRSSPECYKLLKEGLGTRVFHMKLFADGWWPLRMAGKRKMMPLAVELQHQGWMKATWNKWNLSLNICTVFHARQLLQKSESLQPVFTISCQQLGETRVSAKWNRYMFSSDQRTICVVLATTHLQQWRNEGSASICHILMAGESWMHLFDAQLKWQNAECHAQMSLRKKIACHNRVLWESCMSCSSSEMDLIILYQLVQ
jgi:hypothetical protein